jgi:hypothetical protein
LNHSYCFIGASPDRRVFDSECKTSHWGLLEIKCTPADSVANCDYLSVPKTSREGMLQLKHSHSYYYQIMGQMGITGAAWCDFFVFSCNDFHMERIMFDDNFFSEIMNKVSFFFFTYFLPHLRTLAV